MTGVEAVLTFAEALDAQPAALRRIAERVENSRDELRDLAGRGRVLFTAIGASRAAALPAVTALRRGGLDATLHHPDDIGQAPPDSLLVAVSQSGGSREVVEAVRRHGGTRTLGITARPASALARATERALVYGPEADSVASTIGYTGSLVALHVLVGSLLGEFCRPADLLAVDQWDGVDVAAAALADQPWVDVVAPHRARGSAEAGALLLREVAGIPALGTDERTYRHGMTESSPTGAVLLLGASADLASGLRKHYGANVIETPAVHSPTELGEAVTHALLLQRLAIATARSRGVPSEQFGWIAGAEKL